MSAVLTRAAWRQRAALLWRMTRPAFLTLTLTATWPPVLSVILVGAVVSVLHLAVTRLMAPDVLTEGFAMLARSKVGARLPFVRGARERAASREVNT